MSPREVLVDQLIGRRVRDAAGRPAGRIEELICEIELREDGRDYVVTQIRIGSFGRWDWLAGSVLTRELIKKMSDLAGYRQSRLPWERMDLTDPARPRLRSG
jgi:hypothetical protein